MINKNNHKCIICGTEYNACNNCKRIGNWRAVCDTEVHYKIHIMINEYRNGRMSKNEAATILNQLRISRSDARQFLPVVADMLKQILTEDDAEVVTEIVMTLEEEPKPKTRGRKKKVEPEVEVEAE